MKNTLRVSLILLISGLSVQTSCENSEATIDPPCIQRIIDGIKSEPVHNPPARVVQWTTDNHLYFYVTADCCDQYNLLYDDECHLICAPDGGFTGKGDGQCPDFDGDIEKTVIWEDTREG